MIAVAPNLAVCPDPLPNYGGAELRTRQRSEPDALLDGQTKKLTGKAVEKPRELKSWGVEWAPWGGQSGEKELTVEPGFREKEAHGHGVGPLGWTIG